MADNRFGSGVFVQGVVVNRKDDPTQTGRCRVRWNIGGINQSDLKDEDLPWSKPMFTNGNASKGGMGGPHTGFQEDTVVWGFSETGDGQDIIIMGSSPKAGNSGQTGDGSPQYDSDIPAVAKSQTNGQGGSQPRHGDKNMIVTQKSIWQFGQDEGGPEKKSSLHADLDDSIGVTGQAITYEETA